MKLTRYEDYWDWPGDPEVEKRLIRDRVGQFSEAD